MHYLAWENECEELYDLAKDPGEQHDLSDSLATHLPKLRKVLAGFPRAPLGSKPLAIRP